MTSWAELRAELAAWRDAGRAPDLWWRDDDATVSSAALDRLLALSQTSGVPVALAVVSLSVEPEVTRKARCVLMHGCDHCNRAAPGEKKTEFSAAESDDAALDRLAAARERLSRLAGERFIAALAPPWNRLKASLVPRLGAIGILGLSRYGAREARERSIREVNTHVDVIAWAGSRGFVGEEAALGLLLAHLAARRRGAADAGEPTGLLTHHAVLDGEAWRFIARLFEETRRHGAAWAEPAQVFASAR